MMTYSFQTPIWTHQTRIQAFYDTLYVKNYFIYFQSASKLFTFNTHTVVENRSNTSSSFILIIFLGNRPS